MRLRFLFQVLCRSAALALLVRLLLQVLLVLFLLHALLCTLLLRCHHCALDMHELLLLSRTCTTKVTDVHMG